MPRETPEASPLQLWLETGEMNLEQIEHNFEPIIEGSLAEVENYISRGETEIALTQFIALNSFVAAAATQNPPLIQKLSTQVGKLLSSARALGKSMKADSVSIAVGFPWGVSVDLSWDI